MNYVFCGYIRVVAVAVIYLFREVGKIFYLLLLLLAVAKNSNSSVPVKHTVTGGTVADSSAEKLSFIWQRLDGFCTEAKYNRSCLKLLFVCKQNKFAVHIVYTCNPLRCNLYAHIVKMRTKPFVKLASRNIRQSRIIINLLRNFNLVRQLVIAKQHKAFVSDFAVYRCGNSGRTTAHNRNIKHGITPFGLL